MRVRRTLPPAAVPLNPRDLWNGFKGFLAGDPYAERLLDEIRRHFNVKYVFLVSSGKASLYLILKALASLRPGRNDVLIPAYTCFSVPSAIVRADLNVTLCDIDPSSLDFDRAILGDKITEKTLCIVPNHLFGIPSKIEDIKDICRKKGVFVIEDAAQAMGGRNAGHYLGTVGDAGFFSLGRGKAVSCGSGGIVVTNSDAIGRAMQEVYGRIDRPGAAQTLNELAKAVLMTIFMNPHLYWIPVSLPYLRLGQTVFDPHFSVQRLSSMQAGLLLTWRKRLEKAMTTRKRQAADLYRRLKISEPAGATSAAPYLRLPIILENREQKRRLCAAAAKRGLGITPMYPSPINEIPQLAHRFSGLNFPAARLVADRLITLPLHEFVKDGDRDEIVRLIAVERPGRDAYPASGSVAMKIPRMAARERG